MPTLFISYKRGTTAIAPIMDLLRDAKYRLWFDRDDIHLGDPDWQERIDRGLERSQGVILGITPAACDSKPIQYEVAKARELNLPIFPLILERVRDIPTALREIGLPENQHVEDITDVEHWDARCAKLLTDLNHQGLRVTRHDLREARGEAAYNLHQRYLKRLVERIGRLQLSTIALEQPDGVPLELVYVDGPTTLAISVEVKDRKIVGWTVDRTVARHDMHEGIYTKSEPKLPAELGYETASLESIVDGIQQWIDTDIEEHPDWSWRWKDEVYDDVRTLDAQDVAAAQDRLVVLGAPGSGKSTFVKHLALCLTGEQITDWSRSANLSVLGQWPHGALTPIYIELRRFVTSEHFPAKIHDLPTVDHLWRYIEADLLGTELADYAGDLRQDLEQGHAVLILDGLDEVPYPERELACRQQQLRHLATSLNDAYGSSRIIVASRPYAYEGWTLPGFEAVTLADFEDDHRRDLATRLYQAAGMSEDDARAKADRLNQALGPIDPQLKDRPLFLTLMATIFLRGDAEGLPTRRGALYRQSILLLLDRWTQTKPDVPALTDLLGGATLENLYDRLASLAYDVHSQCGDETATPEIEEMLLYKHLQPMGRHVAVDLIPYLSENAGVLVSPGQNHEHNVFYFAHRSFQEYLAGAHLVQRCQDVDSYESIRNCIQGQPQLWREPCKLAGDVLADTNRSSDLWNLLDDLLDDDLPDYIPADDARWWAVWLAGQVATEQDLHEKTDLRRGERAVRADVATWLACLIETPQALALSERADCGIALGLLGDPRAGILAPNGLPDISWSERIPAGQFMMGGDPDAWNAWNGGEFELAYDFWIAKYPVTVAQYEAFVEAGGYQELRYWTDEGWAWKDDKTEPLNWNHPKWHIANHPVIGVTWYEAWAYTQWLDELRQVGDLNLPDEIPEDYIIRLPREWEWEKATRYPDGRKFPWVGEFDVSKLNNGNSGIGRTSAVGMFPDGAASCGAHDLSGNVWEWCLTKWTSGSDAPDVEDNREDGEDLRIVRGGSWDDPKNFTRAASRFGFGPYYSSARRIGFRVVCSRPLITAK